MDKHNEPSLDEVLRKIWDETGQDTDEQRNERGRKRLERYIMRHKAVRLTKHIAGFVAASLCLALIGATVYHWVKSDIMEQPTCFVLATSAGSAGEFELPDGSRVWLNVDSRLEYTSEFADGKRRDVKLTGEGYFEVQRDSLRPFTVEMDHISIEVLGTVFNARSYKGEATEDVVLLSGAVKVDNGTRGVTLRPDQRYVYNVSAGDGSVVSVDAASYCQWFDAKQMFDNTPLRDIIVNLERRYGVIVMTENDINCDKRLSIVVVDEPITEVMDVLCLLADCRYTINGSSIVLSSK